MSSKNGKVSNNGVVKAAGPLSTPSRVSQIFSANQFIQNLELLRGQFARMLDGTGRNLNADCKYPDSPDIRTYQELYDREGIATRVVSVYPDECWSLYPELVESEDSKTSPFEQAWEDLVFQINPWHYLHRIDELSGIGQFGIVLMGFDDGRPLDQPVPGINERNEQVRSRTGALPERKLLWLRTFSEVNVQIGAYVEDVTNPRYGQPLWYNINFVDPRNMGSQNVQTSLMPARVHWSRIQHIADNRKSSEILGTPRLQTVLNRCLDLRKTYGGSAEMLWKGGFPGMGFETLPDLVGEGDIDEDTIKQQMDDYSNHLKRFLAVTGVKIVPLNPNVANPEKHVNVQLEAICTSIGVPLRIFRGSEAGHLASTQDSSTWNRRLSRRQQMYINPMIIYPFVDRLIKVGVLPPAKRYIANWSDLNAMADKDKADVGMKRAQAILQYVTSGSEELVPNLEFLMDVLSIPQDRAEAILAARDAQAKRRTDKVWKKKDQPKGPASSKQGTKRPARNGLAK
jgi:hypothetical protein